MLTDWEQLREWSPTLLEVKGDIRHGETVECVYRFRGNEATPKHTLHYEEGREFGWSDPLLPGIADCHRFRVEGLADGRTRFVQTDEVKGPLCLFFGGMFMREMAGTYPAFNIALKNRVENQRLGD